MECIGRFWGPQGGVGSAPRRARALLASLRRPLAPGAPIGPSLYTRSVFSLVCCATVGIEYTDGTFQDFLIGSVHCTAG